MRFASIPLVAASLMLSLVAAPERAAAQNDEPPRVQVALLLDTSQSIRGFRKQVVAQWLAELDRIAGSEQGGEQVQLQVSLFGFGSKSYGRGNGFTRQLVPFTEDLDTVKSALDKYADPQTALDGGKEYCGEAIDQAARIVNQDGSEDVTKIVYIAGNEDFLQSRQSRKRPFEAKGTVGTNTVYEREVVPGPRNRYEITVHTTFCGPRAEALRSHWKQAAELTGGDFTLIERPM